MLFSWEYLTFLVSTQLVTERIHHRPSCTMCSARDIYGRKKEMDDKSFLSW
jgi:hypothetical protein